MKKENFQKTVCVFSFEVLFITGAREREAASEHAPRSAACVFAWSCCARDALPPAPAESFLAFHYKLSRLPSDLRKRAAWHPGSCVLQVDVFGESSLPLFCSTPPA
jgi:hypothetical protein